MHPTKQFKHTHGYRAQRSQCPLLFPQPTGQTCTHEQFAKGCGCVKDLNCEKGAQMRVTLNRDGPFYKVIYVQRTSAERINSQAKADGALSDLSCAIGSPSAVAIRSSTW